MLWSKSYIELAWYLAHRSASQMLGLSSLPQLHLVNLDWCKWHSSYLPPWKHFSLGKLCVFYSVNLQVTHRSLFNCCRVIGLWKKTCFQSCWLWEGAQQGSFCQHWSIGGGNPDLPPVGLIEVEGPPYVFPRRVTGSPLWSHFPRDFPESPSG